MAGGPGGPKRPTDGNGSKLAEITTSGARDLVKSVAAELGSRGGKARAARMTPERRREIAKKAAAVRWAKVNVKSPSDVL
jgi:hypothetical protein